MLGQRSAEASLLDADRIWIDHVGADTFYGLLARHRDTMFRDEDFAEFYCKDNGRTSVAPSVLATALLLQAYDGVSDQEATTRAAFDMRWIVALGARVGERPFAKSTMQLFRARLIANDKMRAVFCRSLECAREKGYLKEHGLTGVLDAACVLGRGVVKDRIVSTLD